MFPSPRSSETWFGRRTGRGSASRPRCHRSPRRWTVEALEARTLLSNPDYLIAATVASPGENPAYNGPVLLYSANGNGTPTPLSLIPPHPQTTLYDPRGAAFNPATGELFVGNHEGGTGGSI